MAYFAASASLAAGATATPFTSWNQRTPKVKALLEVLINASAAGLVMSLTTGNESIVQADIPISGGGTAGTLPARLTTEVIADMVEALDEIVLSIRNPTGGAITYNLIGVLTPR